ncbi:hypothetical protein GCM10028794_21870 [Silanimonas algicola]
MGLAAVEVQAEQDQHDHEAEKTGDDQREALQEDEIVIAHGDTWLGGAANGTPKYIDPPPPREARRLGGSM